MRVIELTDLYPPAIGGIERFVVLLSDQLVARGHEVHVVASALPGAPAEESSGGVSVHRVPLLYQAVLPRLGLDAARPFHPPAPDPLFRRRLAEIVEEVKPDVIHAHAWSVFSSLARSFPRTPVLMSAHDYGLVCARRSLVHQSGNPCPGPAWRRCPSCAAAHYGTGKGRALAAASLSSRHLLGRITKLTAVSDFVGSRLSPSLTGIYEKPIETLHSFIPDGLYDAGWEAERPVFIPAQDGYLLYVGQLSRHKGVEILLDAYKRLSSPPPLVLLGTPHPSTPDPALLPPGVTMVTNVEHASVIAAMVRAACVVIPSVWPDPLPMTVSEAQNCGVPVVASAVGGIPEQVLDGETGWLVPPGDERALADRLAEVLAAGERNKTMGEAGRVNGLRFAAAYGIDRFEEALHQTSQAGL